MIVDHDQMWFDAFFFKKKTNIIVILTTKSRVQYYLKSCLIVHALLEVM